MKRNPVGCTFSLSDFRWKLFFSTDGAYGYGGKLESPK